ncbi:MAG TPA: transposase [Clostridiales bacterium]|nr:transposase [Clostridiales bacterium]
MNDKLKIRKNVRLPNYDYSTKGGYFVTICLNQKECILGNIENDTLIKNEKNIMVETCLKKINEMYLNVKVDEYVIMPNHIHMIINILEEGKVKISNIIQWFKTITTNEYIKGVKEKGWEKFDKKLWQRNYYEHVIRNEKELYEIRKYIQENPIAWKKDKFYYSDNYM